MSELVNLKEVTKGYRDSGTTLPAVRNVSLRVGQGEFLAIMGQSGSGKSTLLNLIGGIDRPDQGEVHVAGTRIDRLGETGLARFRRRHIGIVFQFYNLIHNLDVRANIELPGQLAGLPAGELRARCNQLLHDLEIADLASKLPSQLSGGQRQRVAIARALINKPTLLLADEPTGALDQEAGQAVLKLFRRFHEAGQTIVMVTHDPKVAGHAERIAIMQDGQLQEETRPNTPGKLAERLLGIGGSLR